MALCIPTYMLASGLIAEGMNWWQALLTIGLGNLIVLVPILLNAHAGHEVRHPVPGLRARLVRHCAAPTCRRCCARSSRAAGSASRPAIGGEAVQTSSMALWPGFGTLGCEARDVARAHPSRSALTFLSSGR